MPATREQVMTALVTKLSGAHDFKLVTRRNRSLEGIAQERTPALIVVEHDERYEHRQMQPAIRRMMVKAIVYVDAGTDEEAVPSAPINAVLDAFDAMLGPDNVMVGRCTLGGLVEVVTRDGEIIRSAGDETGKSVAIVPLTVLLP